MEYKILIRVTNSNYFEYYKVSDSEGDWHTTDKAVAIEKINELLKDYGLEDMNVVFNLTITKTIEIPDIPTP